jgi:ribosome-binding factor A
MAKKRVARLNEQLKRELTQLLQFEVKDPRVGAITITDVEVTPDLYHAKVFYTLLGDDDERKLAEEGLRAAAGFLRSAIGGRLHIRRAPELHFRYDDTLENAMHIERLLREARAGSPPADGDGDDGSAAGDADE